MMVVEKNKLLSKTRNLVN